MSQLRSSLLEASPGALGSNDHSSCWGEGSSPVFRASVSRPRSQLRSSAGGAGSSLRGERCAFRSRSLASGSRVNGSGGSSAALANQLDNSSWSDDREGCSLPVSAGGSTSGSPAKGGAFWLNCAKKSGSGGAAGFFSSFLGDRLASQSGTSSSFELPWKARPASRSGGSSFWVLGREAV